MVVILLRACLLVRKLLALELASEAPSPLQQSLVPCWVEVGLGQVGLGGIRVRDRIALLQLGVGLVSKIEFSLYW